SLSSFRHRCEPLCLYYGSFLKHLLPYSSNKPQKVFYFSRTSFLLTNGNGQRPCSPQPFYECLLFSLWKCLCCCRHPATRRQSSPSLSFPCAAWHSLLST